MKPCNLYILSKMKNMRLYGKYYASLTGEEERTYKPHEANSLAVLVEELVKSGLCVNDFDGFYYGFIIPQIGKEFDILKICDNVCLNIELKSWVGDIEAVKEQLLKNRFYLAHIDKEQYFFTFNSDTKILYKLNTNNELQECDLAELVCVIKSINGAIGRLIDDYFEISQFVLCPTESPRRFLAGEYFLTLQQQQIKRNVILRLKSNQFAKISGGPGTGKTLLLYELAISFAKTNKVCFIQPGAVLESQKLIESAHNNLKFVQVASKIPNFNEFEYILVDESERYSDAVFNQILYSAKVNRIKCVFCFEKSDVALPGERSISSARMAKIRGSVFTLSGKIRINNDITRFICALFDKTRQLKVKTLENVQIYSSASCEETNEIIEYLAQKQFKKIAHTYTLAKKCEKERGDLPLNVAYGKEYDNVCVVIGSEFYYNSKGKLCERKTNTFADNLYYAVTRVRKKLCIIVQNNDAVLERALSLKLRK